MFQYDKVEDALEALRRGEVILVTDDEDRENEGDFICSAQAATMENVNLMAKYARGLICMPMSRELAEKLEFHPMVEKNMDNHETAFTVSVDYVGTTTGISALERGMTARRCVAEDAKPERAFERDGVVALGPDHACGDIAFVRIEQRKIACGVAQAYVALLYAAFRFFAEGLVELYSAVCGRRVCKVFNRYAVGANVKFVSLYR